MNGRTIVTTAALVMAALSPAEAQTAKDNPSLRDILNRAQTQSDRKAVEDLIGKLRTRGLSASPPPAPAAPSTTVSAPATPAAPSTPAATAAGTPPAGAPPAPAATASAPLSGTGETSTAATAPAASTPAASVFGSGTSGAGSSGGGSSVATSTPPRPTPAAPAKAPTAAAPPQAAAPATPAPAVTAQPAPSTPPRVTPTAASSGAPLGAPIGPAEALPKPIEPVDSNMARAPEIAREMGLPNVDIEVLFGYDSSEVTPTAGEGLMNLGRALTDPRLGEQRFVIAGHTDARGTRSYNEALSDRRAKAVRQFLIEHFKIAPDRLVARGFGETQLKNPRNPRGAENRRVQIINWTGMTAGQSKP